MIKEKPIGVGRSYDLRKKEDKYFFAAAFNQAQHNAWKILSDIAAQEELKGEVSADDIWSNSPVIHSLKTKRCKQQLLKKRMLRKLDRWLPFASVEWNQDYTKIGRQLSAFLWKLKEMRHYYSHGFYVGNAPFSVQAEDPDSAGPVSIAEIIHQLHDHAIKTLRFRLKDRISDEIVRELRGIKMVDADDQLTKYGLLLLLSCFSTRKTMNHILDWTYGLKGTHEQRYMANRMIFMLYCCKMPQTKVESVDDNQALLLDMINELARCPKEFYDHLKEDARPHFLNQVEDEDGLTNLTVMRRHQDRFNYFALRFLETLPAFKSIGFHLKLGTKRAKEAYPKTILGEAEKRVLVKQILSFGKLSELPPKTEHFKDYLKTDDSKAPEDRQATEYLHPLHHMGFKYHFTGNKIGLFFPKAGLVDHDIEKIDSIEASCYVSGNDIPALVLLAILTKEDPNFIRRKLEEFCQNKRAFFEALKQGKVARCPGRDKRKPQDLYESQSRSYKKRQEWLREELKKYGLGISSIPDKVRDYLMRIEQPTERKQMKSQLKRQLKKTASAIEAIEDALEASKNDPDLEPRVLLPGQMADRLARDLVKYMRAKVVKKEDRKDAMVKLNNTEFLKLQEKIATNVHIVSSMPAMLRELGIASTGRHPFVDQVIQHMEKQKGSVSQVLVDWYLIYLRAKEQWLEQQLDKLLKQKRLDRKWAKRDLHMFSVKPAVNITELANSLLKIEKSYGHKDKQKKAVTLKRGIFNELIIDHLKQSGRQLEGQRVIKLLENFCEGDQQWFYRDAKDLINYDRVKDLDEARPKVNFDKRLRFQLYKDRVSLLMIKELAATTKFEIGQDSLQLKEYEPFDNPEGKGILEKSVAVRLCIHGRTIVSSQRKIKNYGHLRHLLKDNRVKGLLSYLPAEQQIVDADQLELELAKYEEFRLMLIERILGFEQKLLKELGDERAKQYLKQDKPYAEHKLLLSTFCADSDQQMLREYRNAVLHNRTPDLALIGYSGPMDIEEILKTGIRKFEELDVLK